MIPDFRLIYRLKRFSIRCSFILDQKMTLNPENLQLFQNLLNSSISGDINQGGLEIEKNIDLVHHSEPSNYGISPMEIAIMNGNLNWIKEMFENLGISADKVVEEQESQEESNEQENESAESETQEAQAPLTSLQLAIKWNRYNICQLLLEYEANYENIDLENDENLDQKYVDLINSVKDGSLVNVYKVDSKKKKKKK